MKIDIKTIAIGVLVAIIALYSVFSPKTPKPDNGSITIDGVAYSILSHTIDTVTVPHDSLIYKKGKTIKITNTIHDTIPKDVDSLEILKNYYTKFVYSDSVIFKDSMGRAYIIDTIFKNSILSRKWDYHIISKTIKDVTVVKTPPTNQLYIGVSMGFDQVNFINSVTPSLIFKTKKDNIYQLGVGVFGISSNGTTTLRPYLMVGRYWKIKFK